MKAKIIQVSLRNDNSPEELLTTWVDKRPGLKEGMKIRLKDHERPEEWWRVETIYHLERDGQDFDWHRKWTNNI